MLETAGTLQVPKYDCGWHGGAIEAGVQAGTKPVINQQLAENRLSKTLSLFSASLCVSASYVPGYQPGSLKTHQPTCQAACPSVSPWR